MEVDALRAKLQQTTPLVSKGRVRAVAGLTIRLSLPLARLGDLLIIRRRGKPLYAEVVGFDGDEALALPLGDAVGIGPEDEVESTGEPLTVPAHPSLLGRVVDGLGRVIDGAMDTSQLPRVSTEGTPPEPLSRKPINERLHTGIRAIDSLMTLGIGQRIGLFSGSGVGKSTLLASMARGSNADVVIVALVGERGREVSEFIETSLGVEARKRSIVVVATSDAPALERLKAAQTASSLAEYFRDRGQNVLLLMDSITRVARAQREVGLAAGEPPVRRGYPPSVFAMLPRLLERSGQAAKGSITAIYTVLVEGDSLDEPITDEVRGVLDGHIVLSRALAEQGHYPAIDVNASLSRVMDRLVTPDHTRAARVLRSLIAAYEAKRDLVALGAYARGSDKKLDCALDRWGNIERFLRQDGHSTSEFTETLRQLQELVAGVPL
ncbi:MAG TPA: FliI/YscN family ATPase [Polyangiaceae bacterium]|nr:FliI/YscN family ATPase [Polyangiaceae bacterium]